METIDMDNASRERGEKIVAGETYLTSSKAAQHLGVSKVTLLNYARKKRISHLVFGGFILFKPSDLNEFINELRIEGYATRKSDRGAK